MLIKNVAIEKIINLAVAHIDRKHNTETNKNINYTKLNSFNAEAKINQGVISLFNMQALSPTISFDGKGWLNLVKNI